MKKNTCIIVVLFLTVVLFGLMVFFINYNKKITIDIKDDYTHNYVDYYNYYEDYNQGLLCSKDKNVNILLIFSSYSLSYNSFRYYINTNEVSHLIKNNVVIFLFVDDKAFYHNTTKGEFNKLLQNKFNSPYIPSVLIIDNKENIIVPSQGYISYDKFILFLKKYF